MVEQSRLWPARLLRHLQRGEDELRVEPDVHRPVDHLVLEQVQNHREVQPTFAGLGLRRVRDRDAIGRIVGERAGHVVLAKLVEPASPPASPAPVNALQPMEAHQAGHTMPIDTLFELPSPRSSTRTRLAAYVPRPSSWIALITSDRAAFATSHYDAGRCRQA